MREALYYEKATGSSVRCLLCPHFCTVAEGKSGICKVRVNKGGRLLCEMYGKLAAIHSDPIEKKPLYHFYPGSRILSVGGIGCNLRCSCCQNASISQVSPDNFHHYHPTLVPELIELAVKSENNPGIAYTYNEPFTFFEFMLDSAAQAKEVGLKNVMVSNGFVNPEPLQEILPFIDAFNIDLKGFDETFYHDFTGGSLDPVLKSLGIIYAAKKHLEITCLVVPGENDDPVKFEEAAQWIASNLDEYVPLHISRYFPAYKINNPPTPVWVLEKFYDIASRHLKYVYLGNVQDVNRSSTRCPGCGKELIRRNNYDIKNLALSGDAKCGYCGFETRIKC